MKKLSNKELIKSLYEKYKRGYLNELYDAPLEYNKESNTKYTVYDKDGSELAYFLFRFMYDVDKSPVDYKKYKLDKYWDVSWYWTNGLAKEKKNAQNFIRVTSTSFKIVNDFISSNNSPSLISFGGLTDKHDRLYSNKDFLDRWKILFGERYKVNYQNDKVWIANKNVMVNEVRIARLAEAYSISISEAYRRDMFPSKKETKGISRHNLVKEQIKRVALKRLYMK